MNIEKAPETIRLASLPEAPTGWTRTMSMHLNFGGGKGAATFSIHDEQGRKVEGISYGYDTRQRAEGFMLHSDPEARYLTWTQLREAYANTPKANAGG